MDLSSSNKYIFSYTKAESKRLELQDRVLTPYFIAVLQKVEKIISLKNITFIDFGCGNGNAYEVVKSYIGDFGNYIGIDKSLKQVTYAKNYHPELKYKIGDENDIDVIKNINVANVVYMRFVLMHQKQPNVFIKKIYEAMPLGSVLIIQDSINSYKYKYDKLARYPVINKLAILRDKLGKKLGYDCNYSEQKLKSILLDFKPSSLEHKFSELKTSLNIAKKLSKQFIENLSIDSINTGIIDSESIDHYKKEIAKIPKIEESVIIGTLSTYICVK